MTMLTKKQREEARKRCEAATPGPWTANEFMEVEDFDSAMTVAGTGFQDNAVFIAAARSDLPAALDLIDQLETERDGANRRANAAEMLNSNQRVMLNQLRSAIAEHHAQKADDRCIEDDDRLYAAAGLPPCDRRVGDKAAMLENCRRFIERRCEGGGWPTYRELEAEIARLKSVSAR